jgi:hypothetical protein
MDKDAVGLGGDFGVAYRAEAGPQFLDAAGPLHMYQ